MRYPAPGSPEELANFAALQSKLKPLFERTIPNSTAARTVLVIPSINLDPGTIAKIKGVRHYEERMLCLLMMLRMPHTNVIYVTSAPIDPSIVDYYLHLLPGIPGNHARARLTMLSCHDSSNMTVTEKVLERPRLIQRIRNAVQDPERAVISCFHATDKERTLAVRLGIPMYACDPELAWLGSKSGSRDVFKKAGILIPDGAEHLRDEKEVAEALADIKRRAPELRRAVVKLEEGTSGEGNAVFHFEGAPEGNGLAAWILNELPERLLFESRMIDWDEYSAKLRSMGGIVESWVEGEHKESPSVQCRINPLNQLEMISSHDQVLGGPSGQVFLGCTFPAAEEYRLQIQESAVRVGNVLRGYDVMGRFGLDFVSTKENGEWKHYAIEINLRKGGTTHTFNILQFLTNGEYHEDTGEFITPQGHARFYYATDNLVNADYRRLIPSDLMNIAVENRLHFDGATQQGVFFHLIGAMSAYGKLGLVCVSESLDGARELYKSTVDILDREALKDES